MKWRNVAVLSGLAGAVALAYRGMNTFNRRNHVDLIDPESLVIRLADDLPDRMKGLEGVTNFRDIGGYRTADGRHVRTGKVFRSGALHRLTDKDQAFMQEIGLKLVCDLRSQQEIQEEPDRLPANAEYLHLPLDTDEDNERWERLRALLFNRRKLMTIMPAFYTQIIIERNARLYGNLLRHLADSHNLPAIMHCTAGKDRTGVGVALILSVLGVPEETIIADYSLSNLYYAAFSAYGERVVRSLGWLGIRGEHLQPLLIANPATLRTALEHIHTKYGTVEQYLLTAAGMTEADLAGLRANLLE